MVESYDREKIVECMFDPTTSSLIAELEDGEKSSQYLSDKEEISESEVIERFSYLINSGFVIQKQVDGKTMFSANIDKLSKVVEDSENFGATIEGLEKMDSFLN